MRPSIDLDLINAYVPESSQLSLEEAMKVATQRDEEAAMNLEESALKETPPIPIEPPAVDIDFLIRELYGQY